MCTGTAYSKCICRSNTWTMVGSGDRILCELSEKSHGNWKPEILPTLEKAVGNYKRKTGDERVEFVKLPDTQEGEFGSRQHPGHRSHEKTAKILVEKIQEKMTLLVTP